MSLRETRALDAELEQILARRARRPQRTRTVLDRFAITFPTALLAGSWAAIGYWIGCVPGAIAGGVIGGAAAAGLYILVMRIRAD